MFQFETQNQTLINILRLTTDLRWVWQCSCTLIFGSHWILYIWIQRKLLC